MAKLFISQPMRGRSNEEIKAEREEAVRISEDLVGHKLEVIDSFFENAPAEARPLWFLGKSLELLSTADYAFFAPGWGRLSVAPRERVQPYGSGGLHSVLQPVAA